MKNHFINIIHKNHYLTLIMEDNMSPGDMERASLFYIISGNEDLYRKRKFIYHSGEHGIRNCLDHSGVDFSSGMRSLIRLGFNLYNGWSDEYTTPIELFGSLDEQSRKLAQNALLIRFNRNFFDELME
jgi:hypothetical protein